MDKRVQLIAIKKLNWFSTPSRQLHLTFPSIILSAASPSSSSVTFRVLVVLPAGRKFVSFHHSSPEEETGGRRGLSTLYVLSSPFLESRRDWRRRGRERKPDGESRLQIQTMRPGGRIFDGSAWSWPYYTTPFVWHEMLSNLLYKGEYCIDAPWVNLT